MRKILLFVCFFFLLFCEEALSSAWDVKIDDLFQEAQKKLGKVDVVLTNAGYVSGSEVYLDDLFRGLNKYNMSFRNVQFIHSSKEKPLFFAFFNKESGVAFYTDENNRKSLEQIGLEKIIANPDEWEKKIREKVFSGHEFSILTTANMHRLNTPYELVKAAEFHNHICPGLLMGYMISNFLNKKITLEENLIVFAIPPFCKDDFFQVSFDVTVGKKSVFVRETKDEEKKEYPDLAGVYVAWNRKKDSGRAFVLGFDIEALKREAGIAESEYPWLWRLKLNNWIMKNLNKAEKFLRVIKEVPVDGKKLEALKKMTITVNDL